MPTQTPIVIFVPGAWHTPDCFDPTTSILQAAGYTTEGVTLPSVGSELKGITPPQDWEEDVTAIRSVLFKHIEAGSDVILVAHSYGGTVSSEACRGMGKAERKAQDLDGGVVKLVYLAAVVNDIGGSMWQQSSDHEVHGGTTFLKGDLCYTREEGAAG